MKHTPAEITEFNLQVSEWFKLVDRRQARRFLPDPLPITGFGELLPPARDPFDLDARAAEAFETDEDRNYGTPGRGRLVQVADFGDSK